MRYKSEPVAKAYKRSDPGLYKKMSIQYTNEKFQSLPWINNIKFAKELNRIYEEANQITSLRAFVAIYSGILLWIGCWNLLHVELTELVNRYIWNSSMEIGSALYGILGVCAPSISAFWNRC